MARNRYDMDEVLEDSFDINQLKRLAGYVAPYKKKMAGIIFLMLTSSALTMLVPIFFQRIMDIFRGKICGALFLSACLPS